MAPTLQLLERAAPPGSIRLWVAVHGAHERPRLVFEMDGSRREPKVLLPLEPTLPAPPSGFTTLVEFTGLEPGSRRRIEVRDEQAMLAATRVCRTLPERLGEGEEISILLGSCFHRGTAHTAGLLQLLAAIRKRSPPSLAFFLGDQVYLDIPTLENLPDDKAELLRAFERKYAANWLDEGYRAALEMAPLAFTPDDHEFWNNAPHPSPWIPRSWGADGARWFAVARRLLHRFQAPVAETEGVLRLDLPPLSFLLVDSRSERRRDRTAAFGAAAVQAIRAWVDELNSQDRIGIFGTGQSMVAPKASALGAIADRQLANYDDHREVLAELARARRGMILLTGDVHFGRVAAWREVGSGEAPRFFEVISSPMALVPGPTDPIRGIFRDGKDDWPLHDGADEPPAMLHAGSRKLALADLPRWAGHEGDQLAVLRLRRVGGRIRASVEHWSIPMRAGEPREHLLSQGL